MDHGNSTLLQAKCLLGLPMPSCRKRYWWCAAGHELSSFLWLWFAFSKILYGFAWRMSAPSFCALFICAVHMVVFQHCLNCVRRTAWMNAIPRHCIDDSHVGASNLKKISSLILIWEYLRWTSFSQISKAKCWFLTWWCISPSVDINGLGMAWIPWDRRPGESAGLTFLEARKGQEVHKRLWWHHGD